MLLVAAVCEVGRHYYFPTLMSNSRSLGEELTSGVQQGRQKHENCTSPWLQSSRRQICLGDLFRLYKPQFSHQENCWSVHAEGSWHRGRAWGIWKQYCGWPPYRSLNRHEQALSLPIPLSHVSPKVSNEYSLVAKTPWEILQYAKLLFPVFSYGGKNLIQTHQLGWHDFAFSPHLEATSVSFLSFVSTFRCLV